MKKILFTLLVGLVMSVQLMAQTVLEKGYIKMEVTDVKVNDEQAAMMASMLNGTNMEMYFDGSKSKTQMSMMGGMMNTTTFTGQGGEKQIDILMDIMGQKMWITSEDGQVGQEEQLEQAKNAKIAYDKEDTKQILGYETYKVTVTMPGESTPSATGYVTDQIKASKEHIQGLQGFGFEGFPLEFTVMSPEFSMTVTTKEIKQEVDPAELTINGEGYKKMTMEEFQKAMGGMGGMGF